METTLATFFDGSTALRADHEPGRFAVDLDVAWSSLRGIHGGYLTAIAINAALATLSDRHVRTVSTTFLRPALPGPAVVTVEPIRRGRSITTVVVTVTQSSRDIAVSRITASAVVDGPEWDVVPDLRLPPLESCVPVDPPPGIGHFDQADAVLDPTDLPFSHGPRARVAGYVRPRQPRPIDAPWLGMVLDWFPPASFTRVDPPVGGVSIDYTVHVHRTLDRLGDDEWLGGVFQVDVSAGGFALEKGVITDPAGRVLAESFHTRWTAAPEGGTAVGAFSPPE